MHCDGETMHELDGALRILRGKRESQSPSASPEVVIIHHDSSSFE